MLQSITKFSSFIHQVLRNTEEIRECYKMIYRLIQSLSFRTVLIHFVNWISGFCYFPVFSIPI